ncbi:DUF368 domain-containing protein [bacterium]|nr:DUF368 domain-containing protein [bacterium]
MPHLLQVVRGFLMGSADIVPGVSGGTVALVLGIYERLVHAIRTGSGALGSLVRGRPRQARDRLKEVDWPFLIPLLIGIGIALVTLASVIETQLEEHPTRMAAIFFGLVAGSIFIAARLVKRWDALRIGIVVIVAAGAFFVLGLRSSDVTDPALWAFFAAASVAIIAMILPGVSGSFLLLMLGMYEAVIAAVNDRDIAVLAVFGIGAIIGLALFSTLLDWLLEHHHDTVMAALIGLMAGSLRVLWPWPDGVDTASVSWPSADQWLTKTLWALAAAALVLGIGWMADHRGATRTPETTVS